MKEKIIAFMLYFLLGVIVAIIANTIYVIYKETHKPEIVQCVNDEFGRGCG